MTIRATRCLRKLFRPTTLLGVIDECLSVAEPHRRHVATLAAVTNALSEPRHKSTLRTDRGRRLSRAEQSGCDRRQGLSCLAEPVKRCVLEAYGDRLHFTGVVDGAVTEFNFN
jgi:hypothetical protein